MYKLLRNVHLVAGLAAAVFLFAYGLSAAQMAYPIYRPTPVISHAELVVPGDVETTPRALARWLGDTQGIVGDLRDVQGDTDGFSLTIARVGTMHTVDFDPETRKAQVRTIVNNAVGMLNRLHHVRGVNHTDWAVNAWGWFLAAASLLLLVLAVSGVVMWFTRHRERLVGTVVLVTGLVWGLTLLVLMRAA